MLRLIQNIGFIFLIFIGFSCNKPAQIDPVLVEIDSILEIQPDSGLILLEKMNPPTDFNNYNRSYYYIQLTEAKNKNEQSLLPSDSLIDWAIAHLNDEKDKLLKARAYLLKGRIWTELEENEEAILSYQSALDLIERDKKEDSYKILSKIYDDLGRIYEDESLYQEALEMYRKTLSLDREMQNKKYISLSLSNIGYTYLYLNKPDSTFYYFQQALEIAFQSADSVQLKNRIYHYLAVYYQEIKEYEKALEQYQKISDAENKAYFSNKGNIFMNLQQYDSARYYLHLSTQSENIYTKASGCLYLSELEKSLHNYKEAHAYVIEYQNQLDSISKMEKTTEIRTLNHKYNIQTTVNQSETKHKIKSAILLFIFLMVLLAVIFIWILLNKRNKNKMTQKENQMLKNKDNLIALIYQMHEQQLKKFRNTAGYARIQKGKALTNEEREELNEEILNLSEGFVNGLTKACPALTKNEIFHCCLSLLHLPPAITASCCGFVKGNTLRQRKYIIKKKMTEESDNTSLFNLIFPSKSRDKAIH